MWGKGRLHDSPGVSSGITPAHAGKRGPGRERAPGDRDHPRTCGEKYQEDDDMTQDQGSPPHMRGKARVRAHGVGHVGITPAHAGKRCPINPAGVWCGDHPRTCGEKEGSELSEKIGQGSPPHMRGKVFFRRIRQYSDGITPAHAGKSSAIEAHRIRLWDHPRTCGEKQMSARVKLPEPGSPPHMRGKGK